MSFTKNVKTAQTKLRLTQGELSHALCVSFATVNRWGNGNYNPSHLVQKDFYDFCMNNSVCIED